MEPFNKPPARTSPPGNQFEIAPVVLVAILAVLLTVRIVALKFNATDPFFDEAQYWTWGQEPAFGYYSKPPLIGWILWITSQVCGDSTFCIRLPSPIIHTVTSLFIYLAGSALHDQRVGLWSGVIFATLPGISLSSGIISTDVPLLFCWAVALWAFVVLHQNRTWWPSLVFGVAIGIGLNAKYAMAFFPLSAAIYIAATPGARSLLKDARLWVALTIALFLIAPNLVWNLSHGFATFSHTADNAKWGGSFLNVGKGLEFIGGQLGVFGPILFIALLATVWRAWREGLAEPDRLLLSFTVPVLVLITAQAFASRAHANWAATAYVAAAILVTSELLRISGEKWLKASLALHAVVLVVLSLAVAFAGRFSLPAVGDPFQRTVGWQNLALAAQQRLESARQSGQPFKALITDDRSLTAELLYFLRAEPTPVMAWLGSGRPQDHYELTRPYRDPGQAPVLLVSVRRDPSLVTRYFEKADDLGVAMVPAGLGAPRRVHFYALSGYRPS